MAKIFLNFRAGDQDMAAPFLHRCLTRWFGADAVFFSSHSIPAGARFPDELARNARQCQVLLALIGPRWLTMTGPDERPLLANPDDWVRREIAIALAARRPVIPVLVANAPRLTPQGLPTALAPLAEIEHRHLRRRDLTADLRMLQEDLMRLIPGLRLRPQAESVSGISVQVGESSGYVGGVRVGELNNAGRRSLSDLIGSVSVNVDRVNKGGAAVGASVAKWGPPEPADPADPADPAIQESSAEEWGNADGEHDPWPGTPA